MLERLLARLDTIDDGLSYELIVVDEASCDDTAPFLERWQPARMPLRVIRHDEPKGPSGARNAGLAASTGRFVAWIDDDDLTSPDRMCRQRELMLATGARWSCAARVDIDDDLEVIGYASCPPPELFLEKLLAFNLLPAAAQGLLVERNLGLDVGGFDTTITGAEDWDLCIRLTLAATPAFLDEPLVAYRSDDGSLSSDTLTMDSAISAVLEKHADARAELGVEPSWFEIHRSLLISDVLTSRRMGLRRALKMLRARPSLHTTVRCAFILVAPARAAERSRRRRIEAVPEAWRQQARRWLGHPTAVEDAAR